jgi:hypothetical protein
MTTYSLCVVLGALQAVRPDQSSTPFALSITSVNTQRVGLHYAGPRDAAYIPQSIVPTAEEGKAPRGTEVPRPGTSAIKIF